VSASRWPLVGTLAQVWNICLLHSGRPAAVYRCKALKRPFTGATREGEAALPTRSEAVLADERAECHYPNTRRVWKQERGRPGKRPKSKFLAWGQQSPLCLWVIFFDWGRSKIKVKSLSRGHTVRLQGSLRDPRTVCVTLNRLRRLVFKHTAPWSQPVPLSHLPWRRATATDLVHPF